VLSITADSNIFISGLNFAGIPRRILNLLVKPADFLKIHAEAARKR
jgi:hypothetical protein